mgnify:CR=1 FL=1
MIYVTWLRDALFGLYTLIIFALCVVVGLLVAIFVPGAERRARWLAGVSKGVFVLSATPVDVQGYDKLPDVDCVVVSNHASYVDGLQLKGNLPARFSFVNKGEIRNYPIVHFVLRRAGSRFVERSGSSASSRDARQIVKAAQSGQSLAIFPEGTFQREPGLLRLRAGAFVAAVRGEMPIVPIVITGTRHILPADWYWPRYGRISVQILDPIQPDHKSFDNHRDLAKEVRRRLLEELDEPDLAPD